MYLNEKAWNECQDNSYTAQKALHEFLKIYMKMSFEYHMEGIYVPEGQELQLKSTIYPIAKWMAEVDRDERTRLLSFWSKRIVYKPEEDAELLCQNETMIGGTEAILTDSFVISPCFTNKWEKLDIIGRLYTIDEEEPEDVVLTNVYSDRQLNLDKIQKILLRHRKPSIYSYQELWERREELFPMLTFCPSVENDLKKLEKSYIHQVHRKLMELELYCEKNRGKPFQKDLLSKTTPETEETLRKYKIEHTFSNDEGKQYLTSWHMRFTGIPGRIFFVPNYQSDRILVCYIGKKLKTVLNP